MSTAPADVYRASPSGGLLAVALGSTGGLALLHSDGSGATVLLPSGSPVASVAFSQCEDMVASVSDDKSIKVWSTAGSAKPIVCTTSTRKPSAVAFASSPDGQALLLVGGKTGDVLAYRLPGLEGGPIYLLSHTASMLTDMLVAGTGGVLITADRDEKIRVSQFPQTSRVVSYCLGHTAFVSRLLVPHNAPGLLLSGGGDGTVRLWSFAEGQQLAAEELGADAVAAEGAAAAAAADDQASEVAPEVAPVTDLAYCALPPSSSQWGCAAVAVSGRAEVRLFLVRRGAGVDTDDEEVGSALLPGQRVSLPCPATALEFVAPGLLSVLLRSGEVYSLRVAEDGSATVAVGEPALECAARVVLQLRQVGTAAVAEAAAAGPVAEKHKQHKRAAKKKSGEVAMSESGGLRKTKIRRIHHAGEAADAAAPPVAEPAPNLCYDFQKGVCTRGDGCRFSHEPVAGA